MDAEENEYYARIIAKAERGELTHVPGTELYGEEAAQAGRRMLAQSSGLTEDEIVWVLAQTHGPEEVLRKGPPSTVPLHVLAEKLGLNPEDYK